MVDRAAEEWSPAETAAVASLMQIAEKLTHAPTLSK